MKETILHLTGVIMKVSSLLIAASVFFIFNLSAQAELRQLSDTELSEVYVATVVDRATMLRRSLTEYIRQQADYVNQKDVENFLRQQAQIFGLSLNNIQIEGLSYDNKTELILQLDGVTVSTQQLPAQIERIYIPSITVRGTSPTEKSFGSLDIKDINLSGTRIWINSSTVPGAERAIPNMNR